MQILSSLDIRPWASLQEAIELFPFAKEQREEEVWDYVNVLAKGVISNIKEIDSIIEKYTVGWKPERMGTVERNILRIAIWEGMIAKLVPVAVAIDEAVEIAKRFGGPESGRFVNGVLGRIARSQEFSDEIKGDTQNEQK